MATTGWVLPTARTVDAGSGTWTNDANVLADDGTEATFSLASKNTTGRWLRGQTFGFDSLVPAGSTIDGVEIRTEWRVNSTGGVANQELQAFVSGTAVGAVRARTTEPTTLTLDTYDITADRSWVRADLLDGTFEVRTRGRNGNNATDPSYRWDHIAAQVTYTVPSTDLTVQDAAHDHTADTPTLTQTHELTAADATHAHTADAPSLTQTHVLTVDDTAHGHTADNVTLTASTNLIVQDAAHGHTADSPAISQTHVLTVDDAGHSHTADSATLTQTHNLSPSDAGHAHTADTPSLTQTHVLVVQDATHAHSVDSATLTQTHVLAVDDVAHAHTADAVTLSSAVTLNVADVSHGHTVDALDISQVHILDVAASIIEHAAESLTLTQTHILTADDVMHTSSSDVVAMGDAPPELFLVTVHHCSATTRGVNANQSANRIATRTSHNADART